MVCPSSSSSVAGLRVGVKMSEADGPRDRDPRLKSSHPEAVLAQFGCLDAIPSRAWKEPFSSFWHTSSGGRNMFC